MELETEGVSTSVTAAPLIGCPGRAPVAGMTPVARYVVTGMVSRRGMRDAAMVIDSERSTAL